jgi:hypothetical protein
MNFAPERLEERRIDIVGELTLSAYSYRLAVGDERSGWLLAHSLFNKVTAG